MQVCDECTMDSFYDRTKFADRGVASAWRPRDPEYIEECTFTTPQCTTPANTRKVNSPLKP